MSNQFDSIALQCNAQGQLTEDQKFKLRKVIRARSLVSWLLLICFTILFLPLLFALPEFYRENYGAFWVLVCAEAFYLFFMVFAVGSISASKKSSRVVSEIKVEKVDGEAIKVPYFAPVTIAQPAGGVVRANVLLRTGRLKINGEKYGVLTPQLYQSSEGEKRGTYYYVNIGGFGYAKKVVVNFQY